MGEAFENITMTQEDGNDMPGRVQPGAGVIDFAPMMAALRHIGWKGLVEAELMPQRQGVEGEAAAVAALKAMG